MFLPTDYFAGGTHVTDGTLAALFNAVTQRITAAQLASVRIPPRPLEGTTVRTIQPRAVWTLSLDATLTPAEGQIVANGSARWIRESGTDAGYQAVTDWYVSDAVGDWTASGLDAEHPTTFEEVMRRIGNYVSVAVTIHVMDDHNRPIAFYVDSAGYPASLSITGVGFTTSREQKTITAYVPTVAGASLGVSGERGRFTVTGSLDSHIGKMARVTSGAQTGAQFILLGTSANGGYEMSVPQGTPYWGDPVDIDVGSAFVVEDLPQFGTTLQAYGSVSLGLDNLTIGTRVSHEIQLDCATVFVNSCVMGDTDVRRCEESQFLNCYFRSAVRFTQGSNSILYLGAASNDAPIECREFSHVLFYYVIARSSPVVGSQGYARILAGSFLAVFDANQVLSMDYDSTVDAASGALWSEGIVSTNRVVVYGKLRLSASAMPPINGSGTHYLIGGVAKSTSTLVASTGYTSPSGASILLI